jgi:hypothetical protein
MTQLNKFEDLYGRFLSLGTRMTQPNKFRYLNGHFASLRTVMTHPNKFKDSWWTLTLYIIDTTWKLVLCRGPEALPRAKSRALRKDLLCRGPPAEAPGKEKPSAKTSLPRARPSAKKGPWQRNYLPRAAAIGKDALGKDALGNFSVLSNGSRAPSAFAEGHPSGPRQRFLIFFLKKILCRGPFLWPSAKNFFLIFESNFFWAQITLF